MSEYKATLGTTLRIIDGEYRLGFCQEKEWIELGAAVLRMTSHHEETGAYVIEWRLASQTDSQKSGNR